MPFNVVGKELDLGSNGQFNINTSTAKGLEKAIGVVGKFTVNAQAATNAALYGKWQLQDAEGKPVQKLLDRGLIDALEKIISVDFCRVFSSIFDQVNLPQLKFDPLKEPENPTPTEKIIWTTQKKANQYYKKIQEFKGKYGSLTGPDTALGLRELILQLNLMFDEILSSNGLGDPEIIKLFPETTQFNRVLTDIQKKMLSYTNIAFIPQNEIQDLLTAVNKVEAILMGIQALNNPQILASAINRLAGDTLKDAFGKLDKSFKPERLVETVRSLIKEIDKIVSIADKIRGYINLTRSITRIMILLVRVFTILIAAVDFIAQAIPAIFTTNAEPVKFSTIKQEYLDRKGLQKFIRRLNQIQLTLGLMTSFVNSLVFAMNDIIGKLSVLLANLESCATKNNDLAKDIKDAIDRIENAKAPLQKFLDDINKIKKAESVVFGSYTISIVKEEVTDEGISLRRRYGIATGNDGKIAAQSAPTFASLDEIILNEVKIQLISKGLVQQSLSLLSPQDLLTVIEASKFLGDEGDDLNFDFSLAAPELNGGDLKEFTDNLPGGRALRIKSRKKLISENLRIAAELKAKDPQGKSSAKILEQKLGENKKLQIQNLEDEKKGLQIKLAAAAAIPGAQLALIPIIKRIKEIDAELQKLKTG